MTLQNIFGNLPPDPAAGEIFEELVKRDGVRIERICSAGQISPEGFWYDQEEHEWVILLQGRAIIEMHDGTTRELAPGDHLLLESHTRHRVAFTSAEPVCIWIAVFWK